MDLNPLAPIEIVRVNSACPDPALDMTPEAIGEYYQTHDPRLVRFKSGVAPTLYSLQHLPATYVATVLDTTPGLTRQLWAAALAACHEIHLPDGAPLKPKLEEMTKAGNGVLRAPDSWAELIARRWGIETVYEIGTAALRFARLSEEQRLPLSCRPGSAATPSPPPSSPSPAGATGPTGP